MTGDPEAFAGRLRTRRRSARLSQEELAERSGLSVRAIRDLERGRTRWPYRDSVNRLADALGLGDSARAEFTSAAGRRLPRGDGPQAAETPGGEVRRRPGRVVPRQLPAAVPGFVGRDDHLALLSKVLDQAGGTAVITAIDGMAGVGKTTLAVHWAHHVTAEFPDGQLFVNLRGFDPAGAPVRPADTVRVFLDALGVPADQLPPTTEAQLGLYRSLLVGKRMLIVLDNARDEAQVRPLLPGSPTCRVVVTSRNQLLGLAVLEAAHSLTLDLLTDVEARQLLQHRLDDDRVAADPDTAGRIIASCARLPLALCLVAARASTRPDLPLAHIAADLPRHTGLDAFAGSGDPLADVRAAFSWSYRQLDATTARVFRLAGLHPGADVDRYAIAALAHTTAARAEGALAALARASLIQSTGTDRYGTHDLLRGYARELAGDEDDEQQRRAALTRLFDYYLCAASTAMDTAFPAERHRRPRIPPSTTPVPSFADERAAMDWLAAELPGLVAIAEHTATHGWPGHTTRLSGILFRYLDTAGRFPEADAIHGYALDAAVHMADPVAEADALICLGLVDGQQGRHRSAGERLAAALALHTRNGNQDGQARALNYLGLVRLRTGLPQQATDALERAAVLFHAVGERTGEAYALSNLGVISRRQGRDREAGALQQRALAVFRDIGDRHGEAAVLDRLGLVELAGGRYERAAELHGHALSVYRELGDRYGEATALARLGMVAARRGHHQQAVDDLRQALTRYRELNDQSGQTEVLNGLGEVLLAAGQPAEARASHASALRLAGRIGTRHELARAHDGLAAVYRAGGEARRARHHWRQALVIYTEIGAPEADRVRALLADDTEGPPPDGGGPPVPGQRG